MTTPTDDTTAQPTNETADDPHAAPLAKQLATALTTTTTARSADSSPTTAENTFQAAQPRADTTQADNDTLGAAARHLDLLEPPVTVAIDNTHVEIPDPDPEDAEQTLSYVTLSLTTTDTTLVLAATPLNPLEKDESDDLSSIIDDLLTTAGDTVTIDRVVASTASQHPPVLEVLNQHDLPYIVRKRLDSVDHDIVTHLAAREETTAAISDTAVPAHTVDHDATVLYFPRPRTTTSEDHSPVNNRPADQHRAFVTNTEVSPATVTDRVADYLKHWLPVEIQNVTLCGLLATRLGDEHQETGMPLAAATATYNARQLARHTDIDLDPHAAPSGSSPHADRAADTHHE